MPPGGVAVPAIQQQSLASALAASAPQPGQAQSANAPVSYQTAGHMSRQQADVTMPGAYQDELNAALAGAMNRQTPTMSAAGMGSGATIDQVQSGQARDQLQALADALRARSQGQAPSLAELQMRQGLDQSIASQRSLALSQRGMSRAAANRLASQGIAGAQLGAASNAAMLRAAEQAQVEQALGGVLSGMRGQDIGVATSQAGLRQDASKTNAGFKQQANLANQAAEFTNRGQMDAATQGYLGMGYGNELAQARLYGDHWAGRNQMQMNEDQIEAQAQMAEEERRMWWKRALGSAGAQAVGAAAGAAAGGAAGGAAGA